MPEAYRRLEQHSKVVQPITTRKEEEEDPDCIIDVPRGRAISGQRLR